MTYSFIICTITNFLKIKQQIENCGQNSQVTFESIQSKLYFYELCWTSSSRLHTNLSSLTSRPHIAKSQSQLKIKHTDHFVTNMVISIYVFQNVRFVWGDTLNGALEMYSSGFSMSICQIISIDTKKHIT